MEEKETDFLTELAGAEDLAEKKTKIYARLLTDVALAADMERLSSRHAKRKETLLGLGTGRTKNET